MKNYFLFLFFLVISVSGYAQGKRITGKVTDAADGMPIIGATVVAVDPGEIRKQTERMWENVKALLKEAECTFDDMGQMIVYLRDIADYTIVKEMYDKRFPCTPKVFVHAPVCRPGWLIEMECMGVKTCENKEYAPY